MILQEMVVIAVMAGPDRLRVDPIKNAGAYVFLKAMHLLFRFEPSLWWAYYKHYFIPPLQTRRTPNVQRAEKALVHLINQIVIAAPHEVQRSFQAVLNKKHQSRPDSTEQ